MGEGSVVIRLPALPHVRLIASDGFFARGIVVAIGPAGVEIVTETTRAKGCHHVPVLAPRRCDR